MTNLPDEIISAVFNLQRRLLQLISEETAFGFMILEQYGETEATISDLEILDNIKERQISYYTRLYRLLLQIAESQPGATPATLNLLAQSIEETQAIADASVATVQEVKRDWKLL